jgi:elongation factor 1-gamma
MKVIGAFGPRTNKILVAARYAGVEVTHEDFFPRGAPEDQLKEFKKKNPNVKVPVLETPEGCIYESNAILRYIARLSKGAKLYGATKWEEAQVDQYLDWTSTLLEPALYGYAGFFFGRIQHNEQALVQAREKLFGVLRVLEARLAQSKFLVGAEITIADIQVASDLLGILRYFADEAFRGQFPHVVKFVQTLGNEAHFKEVNGRVIEAKTALAVFTGELPVEESKKAEPKKAAAPQPKKEKQAPAPKKEKKEKDEEEDEEPKEKKEKNALDALPPSPFNLFDFKTLFVNHPDKKEALKIFWEQLDDQGYSVWRMEYEKAEGEGRVGFLTSNLMNGFLQRLETFRKYALGVVGVYGDEPNLEIRGCWVWRGSEIPFEIKDHPSGEWYKFRKLDVKNNEEDRKIQEEYWTKWNEDEDKVEGLTARDVKYFK